MKYLSPPFCEGQFQKTMGGLGAGQLTHTHAEVLYYCFMEHSV